MSWEKTISSNADTSDTIRLIIDTVNEYGSSPFVKQLAADLNPTGDQYHYFKRLYDYVCAKVKYELDHPGIEVVTTPQRLIRDGKGDCKKIATLIISVLKEVGINAYLKHVEFIGEDFTHIYVIVPYPTLENYVTIDPVIELDGKRAGDTSNKFDQEVKYDKATIYDLNGNKMELKQMGKTPASNGSKYSFVDSLAYTNATIDNDISSLAGCTCQIGAEPPVDQLERIYTDLLTADYSTMPNRTAVTTEQPTETTRSFSMGRLSKEERKARRQRILAKVKTVSLALPRAAFLFVLRVNPKKFANKMAAAYAKNPAKVSEFWTKVGGDVSELQKAILAGSKMPPIDVKATADGGLSISGVRGVHGTMGVIGAATIATALTTATPLIIAANNLIKGLKAGAGTEGSEAESDAETDAFDEAITEPAEKEVDSGYIDADLKSAAYSGNRPGANTAVLKYSPEELLKYYADNGIDLNKVKKNEEDAQKVVDTSKAVYGSFALSVKALFFSPIGFFLKLPFFIMGLQQCSAIELTVIGSLIGAISVHSLITKQK